jgi:hypothetical protein
MTTPTNPDSKIDDIREFCVDFGLPLVVLIILAVLMATGIDSELKTLFAGVVGWIIKSGVSRKKSGK